MDTQSKTRDDLTRRIEILKCLMRYEVCTEKLNDYAKTLAELESELARLFISLAIESKAAWQSKPQSKA